MKLHHFTPLLMFGMMLSTFAQSPPDRQNLEAEGNSFEQPDAKLTPAVPAGHVSPARSQRTASTPLGERSATPLSDYRFHLEELELLDEEIALKTAELEAGHVPATDLMPLRRERLRVLQQIKMSQPLPDLTVQSGTLEGGLKQLEAHAGRDVPTLIFDPGVKDLKIPAPLHLKNVRAVDALALIAASARCNLEPIYAPEGGSIAGYRIVHTSSAGVIFDPSISGAPYGHVGVTLMEKDGKVAIAQVRPDSPAAQGGVKEGDVLLTIGEEDNKKGIDVRNASLTEVVKLIRGTPGTAVRLTVLAPGEDDSAKRVISLIREVPALAATGVVQIEIPQATVAAHSTNHTPDPHPYSPPTDNVASPGLTGVPAQGLSTDSVVKIYALSSVLREQDMEEKQNSLGELITAAFQAAGLNAPIPSQSPGGEPLPKKATTLHFHQQSKALIVKAPPKGHELIQQVLEVLSEDLSPPWK